jgi:Domain of unknown function (DUF5680)
MKRAALEAFIIEAKLASYVGHGGFVEASRTASNDIGWSRGPWRYLDSYFGGTDFSGQEVVWLEERPVWAMSYHGFVLDSARIDATRAGAVIRSALSALYTQEGRFLGGFEHRHAYGHYIDTNEGTFEQFVGREWIEVGNVCAYQLLYHGGRVND